MIEIEMSRDIRESSPKFLAPFDKRQLIVILIAIAVGTPVVLLLGSLPIQFKLIVAVIITIPIILCGWVKVFGMPLEVFFLKFVLPNILSPRTKKYMTENNFEEFLAEEGGKNPYKAKPVLRNIQQPKLRRKERLAKEAKLKEYGATN